MVRIRAQRIWLRRFTTVLFVATRLHHACAQTGPARPPIVGVANIAIKTENLDVARRFYSGVVGLTEAFETTAMKGGAPRADIQSQRSSVRQCLSWPERR